MINEELKIKSLLLRYLQKQTSAEESKLIQQWLKESEENANFFLAIKKLWEEDYHPECIGKQEVHVEWSKLNKRIAKQNKKSRPFMPLLRIASAILVLISLSVFVVTSNNLKTQSAYYFTSNGEHKTIILPDSSKVYLNADSELSYTRKIFRRARFVELNGEAYFEVTHNPKEPFIVEAGLVNTKVLGTSFNIKAYPAEYTQIVSLVEGKVEIDNGDERFILQPNQAYLLHKTNNSFAIIDFDVDVNTAWKDQRLVFKNTPLIEVFNSVQRFYGCEIITSNSAMLNSRITASFDNTTIDKVWETLEFIVDIDYEQKDKTTYLIK